MGEDLGRAAINFKGRLCRKDSVWNGVCIVLGKSQKLLCNSFDRRWWKFLEQQIQKKYHSEWEMAELDDG